MENSPQHPEDGRNPGAQVAKNQYAPCLALIRSAYPNLTEAERRVADYILENPGYVLAASIANVARRGNVGLGTVNRLSNKLGYRSYTDLKIALAVELLSPNHDLSEPIQPGDDATAIFQKVIKIGVQNLHDTASLLDPVAFLNAARLITGARRVEVYATGGLSGPIAQITQYRLLLLGVACTARTDYHLDAAAALLREGDVVLGLSNSGDSRPVAAALEIAREAGTTTICITGTRDSVVANAADVCLLVANRETIVASDQVTSRIAMLSVLDALYAVIALHKYHNPAGDAAADADDPVK